MLAQTNTTTAVPGDVILWDHLWMWGSTWQHIIKKFVVPTTYFYQLSCAGDRHPSTWIITSCLPKHMLMGNWIIIGADTLIRNMGVSTTAANIYSLHELYKEFWWHKLTPSYKGVPGTRQHPCWWKLRSTGWGAAYQVPSPASHNGFLFCFFVCSFLLHWSSVSCQIQLSFKAGQIRPTNWSSIQNFVGLC